MGLKIPWLSALAGSNPAPGTQRFKFFTLSLFDSYAKTNRQREPGNKEISGRAEEEKRRVLY